MSTITYRLLNVGEEITADAEFYNDEGIWKTGSQYMIAKVMPSAGGETQPTQKGK